LNVLAVIPARGGSKGIPNKNLQLVNDLPLIAYPIEYSLLSNIVTHTVVSTDSYVIAEAALKYGAIVPFLRPTEISGDMSTTESVLNFTILEMERMFGIKYDYGVFLTATSLFRPKNIINEGIDFLESNKEYESYFTGYCDTKNYWEEDENGNFIRVKPWMENYSSRQIRKSLIREDTGIGCVSRANLWRKGRRIGNKVKIIVNSDPYSSIDIHDFRDLELAREAIKIKERLLQ
jgi:CMP-N-acetylneuraminic acid synthetase